MSRRYKRDDFTEQLNTTFEINFTPDIVKDAELINVSDLEGIGNYESFTITFLVSGRLPDLPADLPESTTRKWATWNYFSFPAERTKKARLTYPFSIIPEGIENSFITLEEGVKGWEIL